MESVKAVKFRYKPTEEIISLFKTFKQMCNDAIRFAIAQDASSRFDLISKSYDHLKRYGLHTHYILSACEVAFPVYRRWREDAPEKVRQIITLPYFRRCGVLEELVRRRIPLPFVKRTFLKLDNQTYRLDYLLLRIPVQARKFIFIPLNGSLYHRSFLADRSLKRGSITITDSSVMIAFSRKTDDLEPGGQIGIDVNARGTSRNCLCGSRVVALAGRKLYCHECDMTWDRDVIASKNIMAAPLVRAARPSMCSDEGGTRR